MSQDTVKVLIAMCGYMLIVIAIGIYFAKRSQKNSDNYFLGGRSLGPWVTAMSAEASDMSGWLLMGLPGLFCRRQKSQALQHWFVTLIYRFLPYS